MKRATLLALCLFAMPMFSWAADTATDGSTRVPSGLIGMNYQGFLTNPSGSPIDDVLPMTFRIIEPSVGTVWEEVHPAVEVNNGLFNVRLGLSTDLRSTLEVYKDLELLVIIAGEFLIPRRPLDAAALAMNLVTPVTLIEYDAFETLKVVNHGGGIAISASQTDASGLDPAIDATSRAGPPAVRGTNLKDFGIGVEGRLATSRGVAVRAITDSPAGTAIALAAISTSDEGKSGNFIGGQGVKITAAQGAAADLVLGATGTAGPADDNGVITTDPDYPGSDLILVSYDRVSVHLDQNADQTDAHFVIVNSADADVFRVDEAGRVYAGTTLVHTSDAARKRNAQPVDVDAVLEGVAALPIERWQYDSDDAVHLGPMSQDFHAQFGLGTDDRTIATVDGDGVALAAIQALHRRVEELTEQVRELTEELEAR